MRSARSALVVGVLLFTIPSWSKQPPQNASTTQPASDPQAIAVVQAAITALGGATSIDQVQSWSLQAQLEGPIESGNRAETISFQIPNSTTIVNGVSRPTRKFISQSLLLPTLIGAILLQESQDPIFEFQMDAPSTLVSKPVNVVKVLLADSHAIAQIWVFDSNSGLPERVFFDLPAQIGLTKTFRCLVDLSHYNTIAGVRYPFNVISYEEGKFPQTLNLQSLIPVSATSASQPATANGSAQ